MRGCSPLGWCLFVAVLCAACQSRVTQPQADTPAVVPPVVDAERVPDGSPEPAVEAEVPRRFVLGEGQEATVDNVTVRFETKRHKHKVGGGAVGIWDFVFGSADAREEVSVTAEDLWTELAFGGLVWSIRGVDEGAAIEVLQAAPGGLSDDELEVIVGRATESCPSTMRSSSRSQGILRVHAGDAEGCTVRVGVFSGRIEKVDAAGK